VIVAFHTKRHRAAADLVAALVLPSLRTLDAVVAAFFELTLLGSTCERALPLTDFDDFPVEVLFRTVDAFFATIGLVDFVDLVAMRSLGVESLYSDG
jgi:hypothetical protein